MIDAVETRIFCFFYDFGGKQESGGEHVKKRRKTSSDKGQSGWWIGTQVGGKSGLFGFSKAQDELPPRQAWHLKPKGQKSFQEDPCGFVSQEDLSVEALQRLDLQRLHGRVSGLSDSVKYFGHFCALLHLEYFVEIAAIRRRTSKRSGEDLAKGGWALVGLQVRDVFSKGKGKGKDDRKGQKGEQFGKGKSKDGFQITLAMPRSPRVDVDRLRFKRGDSVILSATHPLKDRVGEGQVQEINDSIIVVCIEGAETPAKGGTWRVDKGSNRLSYTRQLHSLVSLCKEHKEQECTSREAAQRPKVFELITSAKVGDVDSWTARWSGKETETTKESASRALPAPLSEGDRVRLCGLKSAELNGQEGRIVLAPDPNTVQPEENDQRVHVQLQDSIKAVRLINIEKMDNVEKETEELPTEASIDGTGSQSNTKASIASLAAEALPSCDEKLSKCREDLSAMSCTESQKRAIGATFERRCTIIQGPPGTGKTTTAVQVLRYWAQMGLKPLLAVADGNIAVDNIAAPWHQIVIVIKCLMFQHVSHTLAIKSHALPNVSELLCKAGLAKCCVPWMQQVKSKMQSSSVVLPSPPGTKADVKTVRVGRPEKIRPELEKITLDNQCKLYKQLAQAALASSDNATYMVLPSAR